MTTDKTQKKQLLDMLRLEAEAKPADLEFYFLGVLLNIFAHEQKKFDAYITQLTKK